MSRSFSASTARRALIALALVQLAACTSPEERAQNYLASGQQLLAKGDVVKANIEFRNALKHKKDLVDAWRGLAQIEEQRQNWAALSPILRTIVDQDPNDQEARLKLGRLMVLGRAYDQALPLVAKASDVEHPSADAVALKAGILFALKDTEAAVKEAQRALTIAPDHFDALMILSADKLSRGDAQGALQTLDKAKVRQENEIAIGLFKIRIFETMRDDARIEAELRKLVNVDPRSASLFRRQLVNFYVSRGRDLDAESELRASAAADPANVDAFMDVVRFVNTKRGPDAAQQELEGRIKAGGDVFTYQLALAEFEFLRGRQPRAVQLLEKLVTDTGAADQKIRAQVRLAGIHISQKNLAAADPVIADVLKADNRNIEALRLRAVSRMEQGQLDNAIADLRQALNDQPQSAPLLQLLANALERTGAVELAERHYAEATRASQFNPNVGLQYVAFLQRRGSVAHSEEVLTELSNRNPNNIQVLTALAQAKLRRQDWVGAQEVADTIKRLGDQGGIAEQIRGVAFSGQNKLNESVQALQTAFEAQPNSVQPMVSLVRTYMRAQKTSEAETFLNSVLSASPGNAEAHVLMGSVQLAKNAPEQAVKHFQQAIERQPRNPLGYSALAEFHLQRNDADRALETVRAGLKEQPDNFGLRLMSAAIFERKADYDRAIEEYEGMLARNPESLVVANNLASLLSEHRSDKASLDRAQALAPILRKSNVPHFKDTVGWLSYQRGDYRTAIGLLEEAVQALPTLAQVRYHLGMSYLKAGQAEKAQEQLRKAAELAEGEKALKEKILAALKDS